MPALRDAASGACQSEPDAEPPLGLHLDIVHDAGDWSALAGAEAAVRQAAYALAGHSAVLPAPARACIALSSAEVVHRLNLQFRGYDKPTNVLSFPATQPAGSEDRQLGDVVLAAEVVLAEAAEAGIAPAHHLQHLVVHGLLHLLGYEHDTDHDAAEMERLEVEILAGIGVADPYAARA